MIQDIAPRRFDNAFAKRRAPENEDFVLLYRDGQVLLALGEEGEISFPRVRQMPAGNFREKPVEEACGYYRRGGWDYIYLFSIDARAFYSVDGFSAEICGFTWNPLGDFRTAQPGYLAFAGITGSQLYRWRRSRRFCGECAAPMRPDRSERAFVCSSCGAIVYPKISPAVIVGVTRGDQILLTKYAGRRYSRYALIAGFTEFGETVEDTVRREVMEEVGLAVKNLRYYKSQPWSFSDSLLMGFFCELDGDGMITLDETELSCALWMRREEMPDRSGDISLTSQMMEVFRRGEI